MDAKLYNLSLLDDLHDVRVTSANVNYFRNNGYKCNIGEMLQDIPLDKIPSNSKPLFNIMCSDCGYTSPASYNTYEQVVSDAGEYKCGKCKQCIKRK